MENILNAPVKEVASTGDTLDLGIAAPPEGELLTDEEDSTNAEGLDIVDPTAAVDEPEVDYSVMTAQYADQRKRWEMYDTLSENAIHDALFAQQEEFYKAASEKYNLNPITSDGSTNI